MSEDFKPGEIVICAGLPDSYLSDDVFSNFKEGTEVRIIRKLVSGNYFVERYHPPLLRVRLSPENLKRQDGEDSRCINLAGVEMEGGFKRDDYIITAKA